MSRAIKRIGRAVTSAVKSVVKAVGKVVKAVVGFVTQPFMGMFGNMGNMPDAPAEKDRQQGILVTVKGGGDVPVPVVYGLRQIGGIMFWAETGSDSNRYLWVGYALSEGPIEGIFQLTIEDEDITVPEMVTELNAGRAYTLNKPGSRYSGRCVFQLWKGDFAPNVHDLVAPGLPGASNHLLSTSPTWKRASSVMNGVAVLMARYEWRSEVGPDSVDNNPFNGGVPDIKATIMGRTVSSLLPTSNQLNIEYGAVGYQERYSTNPAEILLDYLRNPRFGKGLKNSEIDMQSFSRAAVKFNQGVQYAPGLAGPILTCNYVLNTDNSIMSNVKILLQGQRSYLPYIQGRYKLRVEDAGNETDITSGVATIVATFTKDDIVGDIVYGGVDRSAQYTEVEVTYVSPSDKWANQTAFFPPTDAERKSFQALDGGRVNRGQFTMGSITNSYMAQDMARLIFNKSRFQQTCSLKVSARAMELEPGDNIHIRGIILDFVNADIPVGDNIPWRIISIKLNEDYTLDLDCVRNPDFIYPHTRFNERDRVSTPFLPGAGGPTAPYRPDDIEINPPGTSIGIPPVSPEQPGLIQSPPTNPVDPVNGGGVGGPSNPGGPTTPPVVPPPPPFDDFVNITRANYTVVNNSVSAQITFQQPDHPQYAGVVFWYKRNIPKDPILQAENNNKPGAGQQTTHIFDNLLRGSTPYQVVSRVKYVDSNGTVSFSTFANRFSLNVAGAVSSEDPRDNVETVVQGWQPLQTTGDPTQKDTNFDFIQGVPTYASTGVPTAERGLVIRVSQDINNSGLTYDIKGVKIYYKLAAATFFKSHVEMFDGAYTPGQVYEFTPPLDLGLRTHPNPDDASDNFDFVFRWIYSDGSEGTRQVRFTNRDIENTTGAAAFGIGVGSGGDSAFRFEESTAFTPEPEPPGSVVDTREIEISVAATTSRVANSITWRINPPDVSNRLNWYGVRVRYRKIPREGGIGSAFESKDEFPVRQPEAGIYSISLPIDFEENYQFVLTPEVRYDGAKTESYRSVYQEGAINDKTNLPAPFYPANGDWTALLKTKTINTSDVSTLQTTPFPTVDPVVAVNTSNWKKIRKVFGSSSPNASYFELQYNASHITGLTGVRLYRRSRNGTFVGNITNSSALYWGLGRWEFVDIVPGTNATTLANGNVLVNVRAPVDFNEYNKSHQVPKTIGGPLLSTQAPWTTKKVLMTMNSSSYDYLLVASTSAGFSPQAMLLPSIAANAVDTTAFADKVSMSTFEGFDAGFQRNITANADNGSRASVANNLLNTDRTTVYTAPTPIRGSAVI